MKIADALKDVTRLFLDTAPVIYYVEQHVLYTSLVVPIFQRIDGGSPAAVVSPVTLAECLVVPFRAGLAQLQQDFLDLLLTTGITRSSLRLMVLAPNVLLKCGRAIISASLMRCKLPWHSVLVVRRN